MKTMLQQIVDYLAQNPDVIDKVKAGTVSLIGLSDTEQQAILDIFQNTISYATMATMDYWQ
jgi:competence protein ComX